MIKYLEHLFEFTADQVVVCSNAFVNALTERPIVEPGRGQVFITHSISDLNFRGNLHIDEGYYYLRSVGDRVLFGGARNLDFDSERTTDFGINDRIQMHLEEKLRWLFGSDFQFEVDQRWSGIMAFGKDKTPIIEQTEQGPILAVKMGGMGIALAGTIGEEVADLLD